MLETTNPIRVEGEHAINIGERKVGEGIQYARESAVDPFQVFLEDRERPLNLPVWRKWAIVGVICTAALCVAAVSSMVCDVWFCDFVIL